MSHGQAEYLTYGYRERDELAKSEQGEDIAFDIDIAIYVGTGKR